MKHYVGESRSRTVRVVETDETGVRSRPLEHHVHHSPDGFGWGYLGSGPAELARCILWDVLDVEPHPACYQAFKESFVAGWRDDKTWQITEPEILEWLGYWRAAGGQFVTVLDQETAERYDADLHPAPGDLGADR